MGPATWCCPLLHPSWPDQNLGYSRGACFMMRLLKFLPSLGSRSLGVSCRRARAGFVQYKIPDPKWMLPFGRTSA